MSSLQKKQIDQVLDQVNSVILGKEEQVQMIFATWLSGGHVLLEDLPGTGKTVLSKCFAKVCNLSFGRVQFTPDLLPNDIIGTTIYEQESQKFYFRKGAIFSDFFLADEINRATPRTQAALLEAMGERQVTVENRTTKLSDSFFVMATQNPIEQHGTFPLPEAQLDRFTIKISLGGLSKDLEMKMIKNQLKQHPIDKLKAIINEDDLLGLKESVLNVKIDDALVEYILTIAKATREHPLLKHGLSARGSLIFSKLAKAYAFVKGRDFVVASDIYEISLPVMNHRVILTEDALFEGRDMTSILSEILKSIRAPKT